MNSHILFNFSFPAQFVKLMVEDGHYDSISKINFDKDKRSKLLKFI